MSDNAIKAIYMKTILFLAMFVPSFLLDGFQYTTKLNPKGSSIDWTKTKDWRLYYIRSKKASSYSADTLKNFKSIPMDRDSMKTFLKTANEIPPEKTPVWMGYYIASCRLPNDSLLKLEISQYGRFFYYEGERPYFQLAKEMQDSWLAYLTTKCKSLESVSE